MFDRGFKTWCENTAVGLRRELGLEPEAPLDPRSLAEHLGIALWPAEEIPGASEESLQVLLKDDSSSWSAVTIHAGRGSVIVLNSAHSAARAASDIAHELAHLVLGHDPARMDVSEDGLLILNTFGRRQEEEANWLAGCLLLPRAALLDARKQGWTPSIIAMRYGVSVDMVQYRLNVTGVDAQMARTRRTRSQS